MMNIPHGKLPDFPCIDGVAFRNIPGYTGYAASSDGNIWSARGHRKSVEPAWRMLTPRINDRGYRRVLLRNDRAKYHQKKISVLVAFAFLGPRPLGMEVCHGPGGKLDDRPDNLRWGTRAENMTDLRESGILKGYYGEKNNYAQLTNAQAEEIRMLRGKVRQVALAERYGVCQSTISNVQIGLHYRGNSHAD